MKKFVSIMFLLLFVLSTSFPILALGENGLDSEECQNHQLYLMDMKISYKQPVGQSDYCYKISDVFHYACLDCSYAQTQESSVFKKHSHSPDGSKICEDCKIYVR